MTKTGSSCIWMHSVCSAGIRCGTKTGASFFVLLISPANFFFSAESQFHCRRNLRFCEQFPCLHQFWVYHVAASTFKTEGSDCMRFEQSSTAQLKWLLYQSHNHRWQSLNSIYKRQVLKRKSSVSKWQVLKRKRCQRRFKFASREDVNMHPSVYKVLPENLTTRRNWLFFHAKNIMHQFSWQQHSPSVSLKPNTACFSCALETGNMHFHCNPVCWLSAPSLEVITSILQATSNTQFFFNVCSYTAYTNLAISITQYSWIA